MIIFHRFSGTAGGDMGRDSTGRGCRTGAILIRKSVAFQLRFAGKEFVYSKIFAFSDQIFMSGVRSLVEPARGLRVLDDASHQSGFTDTLCRHFPRGATPAPLASASH